MFIVILSSIRVANSSSLYISSLYTSTLIEKCIKSHKILTIHGTVQQVCCGCYIILSSVVIDCASRSIFSGTRRMLLRPLALRDSTYFKAYC